MYPTNTLPSLNTTVKPTVGKGELRFFFFFAKITPPIIEKLAKHILNF